MVFYALIPFSADFMEDDCIKSVLEYKTPWDEDYHKIKEEHSEEGKLSAKKTNSKGMINLFEMKRNKVCEE